MLLRDCAAAKTEKDITAADGKVLAQIKVLKEAANDAKAVQLNADRDKVQAQKKELDVAKGANDAQAVKLTEALHDTRWRRHRRCLLKDCVVAETKEDIKAAEGKVQAKIKELQVDQDADKAVKLTEDLDKIKQRRNDTKRQVAQATTSTDPHISTRALSCSAPPS